MINLAQEAAKRAGHELRKWFGKGSLTVDEKGPADYVTDADRRSEEVIRELLQKEVPEHGLLFEEGGAVAGAMASDRATPESEYEWVVDALDGTTNFVHRYPFFAVSIALRRRGQAVLGVVYDPMRGEMFTAEEGAGTKLNGVDLAVSTQTRLDRALLVTGFPFRNRVLIRPYLELFERLFLKTGGMRRDGSAALDLAYVACGRFEAFWELGLAPWDTAAGDLLVREAGGQVSDFGGGNDAVAGGDMLASNGHLHKALLAEIRAVFASRPTTG